MRTEVGHFFMVVRKSMKIKPALTVNQQIQLLQKRGLIINDLNIQDFLYWNNYYRLNVYFHKFMGQNNQFKPNTKFDDILAIYRFDQWLRNHLLSILEPIEIHIKTRIAYYLGINYGSDCFYQQKWFKNDALYKKVFSGFDKEKHRNSKDPVILHHQLSYNGLYPIWVIVEFLSFNSISNFFSSLHGQDKKNIAKQAYGMNEYFLGQWLHTLSVMRNICAHYGYLYQRDYTVRPKLFREFGWDVEKNNSLFAICLIIKHLAPHDDWHNFSLSLKEKQNSMSGFSLGDYGFPKNWDYFL